MLMISMFTYESIIKLKAFCGAAVHILSRVRPVVHLDVYLVPLRWNQGALMRGDF